MSLQSQEKNMRLLGALLSQDLGYIYGERESGPNGAKKQFLSTGRAFLTTLGKDLGLTQQKVHTNKAGIAVSGEVCLSGMWYKSGIKLELAQDMMHGRCLHYKQISDMRDTSGGYSCCLTLAEFKIADYSSLVDKLLDLWVEDYERNAA
jgi:hypothetical protein